MCWQPLLCCSTQTVLGFGIVVPYFSVTYQGWIGGIVSVDNSHQTRSKNFKASAYYLIVLLLQFIPFSLSIGAGIKCGVDWYNIRALSAGRYGTIQFQNQALRTWGVCISFAFHCSLSLPVLNFYLPGTYKVYEHILAP